MGSNPSPGLVLYVAAEWLFCMRPSPAGAPDRAASGITWTV